MTLQDRIGKSCPACGHDGAHHFMDRPDLPPEVEDDLNDAGLVEIDEDGNEYPVVTDPLPTCQVGQWLDEDGVSEGTQLIAGVPTTWQFFCGSCLLLALVELKYGDDEDDENDDR